MISNELLKKKILDEAIHGRLVENDPSLEPIDVQSIIDDIPFEIPNNWKWVKLKSLAKIISGTSYEKSKVVEKGIRILRGGNIVDNRLILREDDVFLPNEYFNPEKQIQLGDIILVASTGSMEAIGKPALVIKTIESVQIGAFLRIVRSTDKLSKYIGCIFLSDYYRNHIRNCVKGTAINNIKNEYINEMLIPIPPLEEQEKIVKTIEELFEFIDKKEKNDKEKEKLKTLLKEKILDSAIHGNLVENDLTLPTIDVEEIKKDVPFDIPDNWKWSMFKDVFNIVNGFTPLRTNDDFWNSNDIPWFTVDDIKSQGHIINKTNQFIAKKALGKNVNRLIPKNTVLLCCTSATIGNYALTNIELTTNQQWNALILNERMNKQIVVKYIYYYVQTLRKKMLIDGNSTTFPFISLKKLGDYLIPIPPLEQQKKIVEKIEECFKLIEQL